MDIEEIEGLGPASAEKLRAVGIDTAGALLEVTRGEDGIENLAEDAMLHPNKIRRWLRHAELLSIPGLNGRHAGLLIDCKVHSLEELARREPGTLALDLAAANALDPRLNRPPSLETVSRWVAHASTDEDEDTLVR